jgi:predicted nucleic acid-binding protein
MIILDTSVWIEYLKRNPDYKAEIDDFLREGKILALDFVFGELMQGAKEHECVKISDLWEILPKVNINGIGFYAGKFTMENKLIEKGVGLIDSSIIFATIDTKSKLWTLDIKILRVLETKFIYKSH